MSSLVLLKKLSSETEVGNRKVEPGPETVLGCGAQGLVHGLPSEAETFEELSIINMLCAPLRCRSLLTFVNTNNKQSINYTAAVWIKPHRSNL